MNAPEAIIITITVIAGIILVMAFHEAIAGLLVIGVSISKPAFCTLKA